ncbi:MAG TPA: methyltransferase domain-containing protein [Pyrinomonadaceae bacterium]|jgi:erythromycin 3''-O-methyltransferase
MEETGERKLWDNTAHEKNVENFYGRGVEKYGDFHNGYLNFGLWENGIDDFVAAAENLVHRMGTLLGLNQESRLLDVACGMGTQDVYLSRHFAPQQIDGLDVTWKHIAHGRRRASEAGFADRLHFHHGTATAIPFPDASYTHVLSIEGPVHFNTREAFMREAHRVLKPGGVFALSDYNLVREPRNGFERFILETTLKLWQVPKENADSVESYKMKLERSGFVNVRIQEVGEDVIPGYYREQRRPETIRELTKIRGFVAGRLGGIIDIVLYKAYRMGLIGYILVRAEKPQE